MRTRELIITTPDVKLAYKSPYLICEGQALPEKRIHAATIRSIQVLEPCILESTVFEMIHRYGIQMSCHHGREYALSRILPSSPYLDRSVYKTQLMWSDTSEGKGMALHWLDEKVTGRCALLDRRMPTERKGEVADYRARWIQELQVHRELSQANILVEEAHASKAYWKLYNLCLPHRFRFKNRTKHPGEDLTNVLLNYGYGILYSIIERMVIRRGLDPACGLFHVDGHGRKSLVYDMIERYRYQVEEMVLVFIIRYETVLAQVPFQQRDLTVEVRRMFGGWWKEWNQKEGVIRLIAQDIKGFKEHLENLER